MSLRSSGAIRLVEPLDDLPGDPVASCSHR
jgi:hypothetical protein